MRKREIETPDDVTDGVFRCGKSGLPSAGAIGFVLANGGRLPRVLRVKVARPVKKKKGG